MATKRRPEPVVRCFEVSSPTLHEKGHTVYKITQRLIRVDKQEEDVQEVSVWRRYNDIKRLYKAMYKLHQALHRKDEFPPFAEAKLFGRFDEDVIIERMRSAQDMLNFVGQRHYMTNHAAFKHFFEGGELSKHDPQGKVLKPHRLNELSAAGDSDSDTSSSSSPTHLRAPATEGQTLPEQTIREQSSSLAPADGSALGGVWQYRQTGEEEEELSLNGEDLEEDNTDTDSVVSTPLPTDTNVGIFDPLSAEPVPDAPPGVSNLFLLSSLKEEDNESDSSEQAASSIKFHVGSEDGIDGGKGDLLASALPPPDPSSLLPQNASPRRLAKPSSLLNLDLQDKGDYIVQAAKQISLAQHCEASSNFHLAFSYYKNGVGILLTGVQLDENETRREVVRRKTARYLIKAEEIHKQHLSQQFPAADASAHPANRWDTGQLSPARELDPAVALLQGSFAELRHFKVLGILNKVMLVMDVNTENTFVIKALPKSMVDSPSPSRASATRRCLVRSRGPYMVELYRFYDNSDVIYLLLQHATGGQLWSYVSPFLQAAVDAAAAVHDLADVYENQHEKRLRARHTAGNTEESEEGKDDEGERRKSTTDARDQKATRRLERFDSALEDVDSVVLDNTTNKDGLTLDHELQHVQYDASKQDSEIFSLDEGSHTAASFHHTQHSSSVVSAEDTDVANSTFQSLLEHTRKQPLAGFAVDSSFDSDLEGACDGPPSRQLSNTIDSIVEEPASTQETAAQLVDNVFLPRQDEQAATVHPGESEEEPSIYDNQPQYVSDSDSESVTLNLNNGANETYANDVEISSDAIKTVSDERTTTEQESSSSKPQSPQSELRQLSKERSAEACPRKRTLSAVFEELELAGDVEQDDKQQQQQQRLPERCVRQWAAELVLAVDALHQAGIICRDLKPANVLLGDRGHLLLSHFSVWSSVEPRELAMDSGYVAPELCAGRPASPACDWWSVGALLYELLTGRTLLSCHPAGITTHSTLSLPDHLSAESASLLTQLLRVAPAERLTVLDIKTHAFFSAVNWHDMEKF